MYHIKRTKNISLVRKLDLIIFPDDVRVELEGASWWILYHGKSPIGFAGLSIPESNNYAFLRRSGILKEHRGRGLQRKMIQVRVRFAKKKDVPYVITYTLPDNPASSNSLIGCGFRLYNPPEPYVGNKVLYFRKKVNGNA